MEFYSFIVENKEIIKIIYALIIVLICKIITLKSHKIFKLSSYQGIRYFRNAFFFYGIAFFIRYIVGSNLFPFSKDYFPTISFLFQFFLIMAGFFLLYSLLWKKIEPYHKIVTSSIFNPRLIIFYIMTILLVVLDSIWKSFYFLFASQIFVFIVAFAISFNNYSSKGRNRKFLKFYMLAMLLALFAWILNALAGLVFNWGSKTIISVYLLNIVMFLLFLFGIIKVTKKN
jgi:hypothetical protein